MMNSTRKLEKWKWKRQKHNWSKDYLSGSFFCHGKDNLSRGIQQLCGHNFDLFYHFFTTSARKLFTLNVHNYRQFLEPLLTSTCPRSYWMPPQSTLVNISPHHISLCLAYSIDETYKVHMSLKLGNLLSFHPTIVR